MRGIRSRGDHSLDGHGGWQVTRKRNPGMDQDIGATKCGEIVRRVGAVGPRMMRMHADAAQ